jgi:opacity protein-like surface antigen
MKRFLIASVLASVALPAMAADLPSPGPPPPPLYGPVPYNWTGLYVGGHLGWAWSRNNFDTTDTFTGATIDAGTNDATTFHGGGQIGYDLMFPSSIVIGASTAVSWGDSSSTTSSNAAGTNVVSNSSTGGIGGNVNARLGYAIGDMLPYATGGWAWSTGASTRTQEVGTTGLATPGTSESANIFRNGWDLGAGLEYRMFSNWTVFGEYRYTSFESVTVAYPLAGRSTSSSLSADSLTLGVNYKF